MPETRSPDARHLESFVRGIPKAELHLHIEGSLEPEMAFELAKKHGVQLKHGSVEALRRAYEFDDLQSFLDLYYEGAAVLRDEEDFCELTRAYLRRAHADGIVHARSSSIRRRTRRAPASSVATTSSGWRANPSVLPCCPSRRSRRGSTRWTATRAPICRR